MRNVERELSDWELQVSQEVLNEILAQDPVYQRFNKRYFVSKSKGRGRKRKYWREVTLIQDTWEPRQPRWYSEEKFPFDTVATEVFPYSDNAEKELIEALEQL